MSKEVIKPEQFAHVDTAVCMEDMGLELNQEQLQELSDLYEGIFDTINPGKLVTGKVVKVDSDGIVVDINYKSDGLIPRYEFTEHELKKFKQGDIIEVILDELESMNGTVTLSYEKAKALRAWDAITKLFEEEKPVEGVVTHKVKGGLSVDIGIPAFLPGSQIDLQRVIDFDQYVGQSIIANILKINKKRGNVIISRRKYLSDQRSETRKQILETLKEGQVIQGQVKNITNYGVFIDIGGVDGLLHITDMTWGRIAHPSELVRIGDTITVKVLSFDKENEKISLGLKQLSENPWQKVKDELKVGDRVTGTISSITDYGLFVEVFKGVEGLIHISEISWTDRINDLHQKFKVGQKIEAVVVSLDVDNRRMSLSIKQLDKNPWESVDEQFKPGQRIKGVISNITDFGIFVQLLPGIDGLVHISDLSWTEHINHPSDIYRKGDTVEAVILGIDKESKKTSLGIKQLTQDPWENIEQEYKIGSIVEGKVSKITNFGAFVKLSSGVEGLVHISELSDQNVEKVEDVLKVGEIRQFKVLNVNKSERKLGLSLKLKSTGREEYKESAKSQGRKEEAKAGRTKERSSYKDTATAPKTKSTLQLELERHAARQKENESVSDDESTEE
jgi:small subunit ribosomal protein S1